MFISLSLYVAICFFAPFCGGQYNPAITLAVYLNKNSGDPMKAKALPYYFSGQFLGAIIGCTFSKLMYDCGEGPYGPHANDLTGL